MKVPLSWLREYVDIDVSIEELAEQMTLAGLEVTGVERIGEDWDRDKIFVGVVTRVEQHPNADRLTLPTIEFGGAEQVTVVTGAPNIRVGEAGMKVAVALTGARLVDGHSETRRMITLKPTKLRGVKSTGMVCSELELGISDEHEGIMELPADAPVGAPLADYMGDVVFELDLTPNLSRCFSMIGVAREVAAILNAPSHVTEPIMDATGAPIEGQIELEILDPDLCNRYTGALIKGIEIRPSPWWMQRRLTLAGMRPINNIVDITNYVMLEWGQPLHAFDYRALRPRAGSDTPAIIVRRARAGEQMTTLDNVPRRLTEDMLLITDGGGPVAIAGVMGGLESEVTTATSDILLEAATFDFINNRRTSQALHLTSEAAIRFGRGIPATRTVQAARRAVQLMRELAGGEIAAGLADAYPIPQQQISVTVTAADVERVIGISLTTAEIVDILSRLDFICHVEDGSVIRATVPEHRLDVNITADLLEEIARVYGYGRIPTTLMADEMPPQRHNVELEVEETLRDILVGSGLQEVITYSLTNLPMEQRVDPAGAPLDPGRYIHLANPISSERATLRQSLYSSLLATAAGNLRIADAVRLFEIGAVYLPNAGQMLPDEPRRLGIVMAGPRRSQTWQGAAGAPMDFFDIKGVTETVLEHLGIEAATFAPASDMPFVPGRAASLLIDGVAVGQLGEVHPLVKEQFELPPEPVCLAEFDLERLLAHVQGVPLVKPVSRYPGVAEDLAVVIAEEVPVERVQQAIQQGGDPLLAGVRLFDIYRGDQIPAGQKSLAFSLFFQSPDRTLTDREVRSYHERIVRLLESELGAQLRA